MRLIQFAWWKTIQMEIVIKEKATKPETFQHEQLREIVCVYITNHKSLMTSPWLYIYSSDDNSIMIFSNIKQVNLKMENTRLNNSKLFQKTWKGSPVKLFGIIKTQGYFWIFCETTVFNLLSWAKFPSWLAVPPIIITQPSHALVI